MIIIYDLETKNIQYTEDNRMEPAMPPGTIQEKIDELKAEGLGFIGIPYELGVDVTNYTLNFNEEGRFIGLQPLPNLVE